MRKKDHLYTSTKWNQPLFAQSVDRDNNNIFDGASGSQIVSAVGGSLPDSSITVGGRTYEHGVWDIADPMYHTGSVTFADGSKGQLSTGAGKVLGDISVNAAKNAGSFGAAAPWVMLGAGIGKLISGGINSLWGYTNNTAAINSMGENSAKAFQLGNSYTTADNNTTLLDMSGYNTSSSGYKAGDLVKGGLFKKDKAEERGQRYVNAENRAIAFQNHGLMQGVNQIDSRQDRSIMSNFRYDNGGFLPSIDVDGAIGYGFMSDYLTEKKRQNDLKNKMNGLSSMPAFMPQNGFAIGGDMQTNSADFSTGLTHINAGLSHDENPNQGVQVGVDPNGVPNLVEEGETIFNDYVYSARIECDEQTKKLFHLPKKKAITYAELSKKLEKEASERPNDPISQAGFKAQMSDLAEQQERQKQEMEAEKARQAFDALSDEEKVAVIQQLTEQGQAQQGQMAQGQMMGDGAAVVQQPTGQIIPEEAAMQQQMQADDSQAMVGDRLQMYAEGGHLFEKGGSKKNVGTWKNDRQNHWDVFTKPGLKKYIENLKARLDMAPDDETKDIIRREAMNELNHLQQSYYDYVREGAGKANHGYSEDILNHQKLFDKLYGNTGFYTEEKDDNGNVTIRNLIADAIDLPKGAATDDKPDSWFDGYNGPRTSIRNFGSTAYGDENYYKDLVDEFADLGLTYAPNDNWKDDNGTLYGLSLVDAESADEPKLQMWDWTKGDWTDRPSESTTPSPSQVKPESTKTPEEDIAPAHRAEWLRYAGLMGPAVGLGMQLAGVGKPNTKLLDEAIQDADDVTLADYRPLGNYLTYRPMDIWYEQNRMNANARSTDRALQNNAAPIGTQMAGLLANGYNSQTSSGNLYRQALEYNDNLRKQVAEFNRGTDQFNADAYNRTSQFNADARNRNRQTAANLRLQAASQKLDADAGWYNGLYGNVSGLFKGISDLGTENYRMNRIADMGADGIFGELGDSYTGSNLRSQKSAGKKSSKRRGLTF